MLGERVRQMEADLERIAGVFSARMRVEEGEISEVHVIADPSRRPKWIARDVVTTLFARHGVRIPHQRVSVAATTLTPEGPPRLSAPCGAIRLTAVALVREGERYLATVDLADGERTVRAEAGALAIRANRIRVIAQGTLEAVRKLADQLPPVQLEEARLTVIGTLPVVLVHLVSLDGGAERSLLGCADARENRFEAVARAVLDAVEEIMGPVTPVEEDVEFEVTEEEQV